MKSLILFLIVMLLPSEFAMANGNKIVSTENYSVDILNNLDVTTFNNSCAHALQIRGYSKDIWF